MPKPRTFASAARSVFFCLRTASQRARTLIALSLGLTAALLVAGCGTQISANNHEGLPTVALSASPSSIAAGSAAMLSVTASNATGITVTGSDGSSYSMPGGGGTQSVSPSQTTTYTAKAVGKAGSATATATVTVNASSNTPPAVTITASPTSIAAGGTSTLSVTATNADQVSIAGSDGSSYTLPNVGGTQPVSPAATTTYTVTASAKGGSATAKVTVTVTANPAPGVTIAANPASIKAGGSSILTVTATNATQVVVTGSDGTTYQLSATGGTQAVSPAATTTYTATATGSSGRTTATATVTVTPNPPPTVQITANPTSINSGGSSVLTINAVNATTVTVAGSDGTSYPLAATGGTQSVSPTATTTYTATADGPGGKVNATATVTVTPNPPPTVSISASPTSIVAGHTATLTVKAAYATTVTVTGTDGSSYNLNPAGGTQSVSPGATTTYTVTATGNGRSVTDQVTITVTAASGGSVQSIDHVIFLMQENRTFDAYFGMLNPYRQAKGWNVGDDGKTYTVDGIDDKLTTISNQNDEGVSFSPFKLASTCVDDQSSDWLASFGDVNRYNFLSTRPIEMSGFVHNGEGFAKNCLQPGNTCSGTFNDTAGKRVMGYYDQDFLNYYYYMASQFAVSDRWFSPVASKSVPNRIATFTGGTTQGLVKDPGNDDRLPQLDIPTIFAELDQAKVTWKIYYTVTQGLCADPDDCLDAGNSVYPATHFSNFTYSYRYLYQPQKGQSCVAPTQPSSVVGDSSNSYCIDPTHIAPLTSYFDDVKNGTLPSFAFIEAGYGNNDEHPGSGQSILSGQAQVANIINALMTSPSWKDSVFFLSYDEGGGPYEHVPPVPGHSNDFTDPALASITPDVRSVAVSPDSYGPCVPPGGTPTLHCDLTSTEPGANPNDAAAMQGFSAQIGFRVPNLVISPFVRRHYVSHQPMDHTAVIKFVENRFIGSAARLTARDAAQPDLLDFFDFNSVPWSSPPTPPSPVTPASLGYDPCTPTKMGP